MQTLNLKKGDQVKILAGKDKGKTGKIGKVLPKEGKVIVEGLNVHVRFTRARRRNEKGQRLEFSAPVWSAKVMLVCPHCGKSTRVAHALQGSRNVRKCKKCGREIN